MTTKDTKAWSTMKDTKTSGHKKILFSCVSCFFVCCVVCGAALLAQARPGTRVRFREATLAEALAARREQR